MCYAVSFNVPLSVGLLLTSSEGGCVLCCFIQCLSVCWTSTDIVRGCVYVSHSMSLCLLDCYWVCVYYAVLFSVPLSVGLRVHVCVSFNVPLSVGLLLTSSEGVCMLYCLINILLSVGLTDIKVCICYISHSMSVLL